MSRVDDELSERLHRTQRPVPTEGVLTKVEGRRRRLRVGRRIGSVMLAVAVLGGTFVGLRVLENAFTSEHPADGGGGVIVFRRFLRACPDLPHVGGGLDVFAATPDGASEWRLRPDATWRDGSIVSESHPTFAPDGERFAWTDHYRGGLWVTDVRTGDTTRLLDTSVGRPVWSPDGSTLTYAASVSGTSTDVRRTIPEGPLGIFSIPSRGGEPRLLTNDGSLPIYSPDGTTIAFLRQNPGGADPTATTQQDGDSAAGGSLWFMNADGSGERKIRQQPADAVFSVAEADWSPDGERLVVEALVDGNRDLYVVVIDTEIGYRLTDHPAGDTSPSWSPDGKMIAFQTGRWGQGTGHAEIAIVSVEGGEPTRVTNDCWDDFQPEWVPEDGAIRSLTPWTVPPLPDLGPRGTAEPGQIIFTADIDGVADLYAIDPAGGAPVNITSDVPSQYVGGWSPDRAWIAYTQYDGDGPDGVWIRRPDGSEARLVAAGAARPSWSPDGRMMVVETEGGLEIVDLTTGTREPLTEGDDGYPAWSPDGSRVAFAHRDGRTMAIHAIDLDTRRIVQLTSRSVDLAPDWSPDGTRITFQRVRDVAVVGADGTGLTVLTGEGADEDDRSPEWSPDGRTILFVSTRVPPGSDQRDGPWLWTMGADGSGLKPLPGSPSSVGDDPDW